MLKLVDWAQAVVTFTAAPRRIWTVSHGFTASTVLGMTIFLIFPSPARFTSGARRWNISPGVTGGTLPALSAGGVYHSSLPVARTRPSRQVRVFIVRLRALCRMAATPYPAYRGLSQAQTSQARAGAAPPGKVSNTVPVISPGGGCRLTRPTESSQAHTSQPAQAAPPGKISGTVPVISPGGGCRWPGLQGPLTGSYP